LDVTAVYQDKIALSLEDPRIPTVVMPKKEQSARRRIATKAAVAVSPLQAYFPLRISRKGLSKER
jgi:hypothetical protein